jgi:hypothetical protein
MCHRIFISRPSPEHANTGDRLAGLYLDTAPDATCATARTVTMAGRTVRRLSPPEIEERRRFNCDEKYVRGHNKA